MTGARRIVSLISSGTEILYLIGLGDRIVGISHECDYPAEVVGKPRLTRSLVDATATSVGIDNQVRTLSADQSALYTIDVERLAELVPDLIVTQAQCDVCAVRYEDVTAAVRDTPALARTQVLALNPRSIFDVLADVRRVGDAVGDGQARARALDAHNTLRARIDALRARGAEAARAGRPRVVCLEWIEPPMVAANWTPELVAIAGGEAGLSQPQRHSTYANWQQIVEYDPQMLVIMPCGFDLRRAIVESRELAGWPGWSQLAAVRDGKVFAVDGNAYFNRSGPRLVDSIEILGHLFHPRRFGPPGGEAARAWQRLETQGHELVPVSRPNDDDVSES